jgi:signal transduction histidine kinase
MGRLPQAPPDVPGDLFALLTARREDLIVRWSATVTRENAVDRISRQELVDQMPSFIDELIAAVHPEAIPLPSSGENAVEHGAQRLNLGFNVAEVVREYGVLHRCIIEIAGESGLATTPREQLAVTRAVNAGIASALSQYVNVRDAELRRQMSEHLGFIAHEVRNPLSSARMAFNLLQKRELAGGGRVIDLLERTLKRTGEVIDNALNQTTLSLGATPRFEAVPLRKALDEVAFDCAAEAQHKGIDVVIASDAELVIDADVRLLHSALANLLQNALKFSQPSSTLNVRANRAEGRVLIEIEDTCGGLPAGRTDDLFKPLVQRGSDLSGYGLGLAIAQQATRAHGGTLSVRDLPGKGCIFTLDLPARAPARQ